MPVCPTPLLVCLTPTIWWQLVPNEGQYPIAAGACADMLTTGPMARHAVDLLPLLRALYPPAPRERDSSGGALSGRSLDLRRLRVVSIAQSGVPFTRPVSREVRDAQEAAASCLESHGAQVERIDSLPALAGSNPPPRATIGP